MFPRRCTSLFTAALKGKSFSRRRPHAPLWSTAAKAASFWRRGSLAKGHGLDSMTQEPESISPSLLAQARGGDRLLGWGLLVAAFLLIMGWLLPMMTLSRFVFLSQEVSLIQAIWELAAGGEYFLFILLAGFSVLFPALKILFGLLLWYGAAESGRKAQWLRWLDFLGRWSMLDVFVVALIVVAVKVSLIDDVELHGGLYAFTAAILLSMLCLKRMESLAARFTSSA